MWFGRGTPHPARSPSDGERVTIRAWGGLSADAAGFLSSGVSLLAAVGSPAPCASARLLSRWSPSSSRATRKKGSTHSLHPVLFNHFLRFGPAPGTPPPGARATGSTSPCPGCSRPGGMEAQHAYATHPTIHCQHPAIPSGIGHILLSYSRGVAPLNPGLMACTPSGVPGMASPQAGGLTAGRRWLRSNATTPPVNDHNKARIPVGCQRSMHTGRFLSSIANTLRSPPGSGIICSRISGVSLRSTPG